METDGAGDPRRRPPIGLLDEEKTGAVLLFSGLVLTLAGAAFTAMGWHHYEANTNFEWTQLLGPVLVSSGGTFVLTGVCRYGIVWPCRERDKEVVPAMEPTPFSLSVINQPTVLCNATAMVCFPPQYNFTTQEVRQAGGLQAGGFQAACPPYACVDNAAFTAGEEESDPGRNRIEETNERGCGDESDAACSPPPAYEDVCPSFSRHYVT